MGLICSINPFTSWERECQKIVLSLPTHRLTLRKVAGCSAMTMGNGRYVMDPYRTKTGTYQRDEPCDQHAVNRLEFSASRASRPVRPRALPGKAAPNSVIRPQFP